MYAVLMLFVFITTVYCVGTPEYSEDSAKDSESNVIRMPPRNCNAGSEVGLSDDTGSCPSGSEETTTRRTTRPNVVKTTIKVKVIIPRGPFYDLLAHICGTLLNRFKVTRVHKYFKILGKTLNGLGSGSFMKMEIARFARYVKKKSVLNGNTLKKYVTKFLMIISSGKPNMNEFFFAMNAIFTTSDDNKMDDYIYLLKKYGEGDSKTIGDRTRNMFKYLIFDTYYKQKYEVTKDIKLKWKLAFLEYKLGH